MSEVESRAGRDEMDARLAACKGLLFTDNEPGDIQMLNYEQAEHLIGEKRPRGVYQKQEGRKKTYVKWYILGKFSVLTRKTLDQYEERNFRTTSRSAVLAPTSVARHVGTALYEEGFLFFKT